MHVYIWCVVCVLRPIDSEVIQRRHPHFLSLAKDVKDGFYTVPIRNQTPGRCVTVHYTTAVPLQLHTHILRLTSTCCYNPFILSIIDVYQ